MKTWRLMHTKYFSFRNRQYFRFNLELKISDVWIIRVIFQSDSKLLLLFFFFIIHEGIFFSTKEDQFQYFRPLDIVSEKRGKRGKKRKTYK